MRTKLHWILGLSIVGSFIGCVLNFVPGRVERIMLYPFGAMILLMKGVAAIGVFLGLPLAILWYLTNRHDLKDFARDVRRDGIRSKFRRTTVLEVMAIVFVLTVYFTLYEAKIPAGLMFRLHRQPFETAAKEYLALVNPEDPESAYSEMVEKRIGIYTVDAYGIDERGGTYLRVKSFEIGKGTDEISDIFSFGFVKNPNPEGSPFGAAHYKLRHIVDDWYVFQVSDDYF